MYFKHLKSLGAAILVVSFLFLTACASQGNTTEDLRGKTFTTNFEGTQVRLGSDEVKTYYVHPYRFVTFAVDNFGTIVPDESGDSGSMGSMAQRIEDLAHANLACTDKPDAVEVFVDPAYYDCGSIQPKATPTP